MREGPVGQIKIKKVDTSDVTKRKRQGGQAEKA
jgi:hypothetical protein